MANHGFVYLPRPITDKKFVNAMKKVVQKRFANKLIMKQEVYGSGKPRPMFTIVIHDWIVREFWLASSKKIEHRHGPGGDLPDWIETVIANDLAIEFKGILGDEGIEEKWRPIPNKYPKLVDWLKSMYSSGCVLMVPINFSMTKLAISNAIKNCPQLKEFIE